MKTLDKRRTISIFLIAVVAIAYPSLSVMSYAASPSKRAHMAGRGTTTLANIIRSGTGAPPSSLGLDGDFYIDTSKLDFYGPKSNGHWPAPTSLRGPAGTNGKDGKSGTNGVDGKSAPSTLKSSTSGAIGPQGIQGAVGFQGQTGPSGLTGAVGPAGSAGSAGSMGPTGSAGSAGPAGVAGVAGPVGPSGSPGSQGATGSQGAVGNTGTSGATGPSEVSLGNITFSQQLKSGSGSSINSNAFGTFAPGKDYLVHLFVYGIRSVADFASLRINIFAVGGSPVMQSSYLISDGRSYRTTLGENDTNLDTYLTVDGSLVLNSFQLVANISALDNTSTDPVTFNGTYLSQLVGAIL